MTRGTRRKTNTSSKKESGDSEARKLWDRRAAIFRTGVTQEGATLVIARKRNPRRRDLRAAKAGLEIPGGAPGGLQHRTLHGDAVKRKTPLDGGV